MKGKVTMEPVVNIQGLHHAFGKDQLSKPVLLDINRAIQPGELSF
jgi:putative ABC transport system ATP-binding protein